MSELKPSAKAIVKSCPNPKAISVSTVDSVARENLYQKAESYLDAGCPVITPNTYPNGETWIVSDLYDTKEVIDLLSKFIKTI